MTEQAKKDLAELSMKLYLLGWVLDKKHTLDTDLVFNAPASCNYAFDWVSFDTKEDGECDAGNQEKGFPFSFSMPPMYYRDLIEIIEHKE